MSTETEQFDLAIHKAMEAALKEFHKKLDRYDCYMNVELKVEDLYMGSDDLGTIRKRFTIKEVGKE
jgi:hypothetical protein